MTASTARFAVASDPAGEGGERGDDAARVVRGRSAHVGGGADNRAAPTLPMRVWPLRAGSHARLGRGAGGPRLTLRLRQSVRDDVVGEVVAPRCARASGVVCLGLP